MFRLQLFVVSESDRYKKEHELDDLALFLRQFEHATGISIEVTGKRERPDFVVVCEGKTFGLELVKVVDSPSDRFWQSVLGGRQGMTVSEASDWVQEAIHRKDAKRASDGWGFPNDTILVVQIFGIEARDIYDYWDEMILDELRGTGFAEIWLSDHGPVEPYGTVEIVGVKTGMWDGVHRHSMFGSKPYG